MVMPSFLHVILAILLFAGTTTSYKILVSPATDGSHTIYMGRVALALLARKHNVTLLVGSTFKVPGDLKNSAMNIVRYHSPTPPLTSRPEYKEAALDAVFNVTMWKLVNSFITRNRLQKDSAEQLLQDEAIVQQIGKDKYDYMILDMLALNHGIIAHRFNIPYSLVGFDLPLHRRVPHLPSHVPALLLPYSEEMTFKQRLLNFLCYSVSAFIVTENESVDLFKKYSPERPTGNAMRLMTGAELVLSLEPLYLAIPKASMPDTVRISTLMAQPAKPLPQDLQSLLDSSEHGAILVSFGSWMKTPPNIFLKLQNVFSQLKQTVIWKYSDKVHHPLPGNIKIMKWIPQNDLLGHPNLKLLATHSGANSILEANYHGVPLLCFPLGIDQGHNAAVAKSNGYAEVMDIDDFTEDQLLETIKNLIEQAKYQENAKRLSKIFKDVKKSGTENPAFWIEHVIKHGPQHLRSSAYSLTWYQFYMVDIIGAICLIIGGAIYMIYQIIQICCHIKRKR